MQDTIKVFIPAEQKSTEDAVKTNEPKESRKQTGEEEIIPVDKEKPVNPDKQNSNESPGLQNKVEGYIMDTAVALKEVAESKAGAEPIVIKDVKQEEDKKFLPIEVSAASGPSSLSPMVNSDCKTYATEDDFLKFRKKLAAADNDDEMITAAKKFFKAKCYSTDQIKNLSVLFLKDAGKYSFFDLAYQYVFDSQNFGILETQLTESYYISRFKAMIRH